MAVHTDFKFHPQLTQIGCYWGSGGHTELILIEGDRLAIVDTGCTNTPQEYVAPALEAMGLSLRDIDVIINTHGHFDHAGGNAQIVEASGAEVWLPAPDVAIAEDIDVQFDRYFAQNDTLLGREDRLEASRAHLKTQAAPTKVDRALRADEVLDLGRGVSLRVIPCPGHTLGCVSYYWEREGILIAGDSITGGGSRARGLPLIYHPEDYEATLDRVEKLDINVLCIGHHYSSLTMTRESIKYGRAGKQFLQESRAIARIVSEGVQSAIRARPEADFLEVARQATRYVAEQMPLDINAETGLPVAGGTAALYANWQRYRSA